MKTNPLKDFFYFPKGDRRAIVALGCIIVFAMGVLMVTDAWKGKTAPSETLVSKEEKSKNIPPISGKGLYAFDPNTVDSLTLVGMGVKAWKVKNFLHYRAAGRVFRSAEDLGDTYGWTKEDVVLLKPYVQVDERYRKKNRRTGDGWTERKTWERKEELPARASRNFHTLTKVDINEADTAQLQRIPGIGEGISLAIVRYRQRLGGFHSVEQLLDIRIVSPELLDWFQVSDSLSLKPININKASFQVLNSHPYISYEQAKALLQYIRLYGNVKDEASLLSTGIFTPEDMERLRPYITYE